MTDLTHNIPPATPSIKEAFWYWLKLGFISFGGPAGQIAMMHQELVENKRWISEKRFLHALNYCMVLPGPEAQQLATYIGWLMHKKRGGLMAGGLFVLPSLLILMGLSWAYLRFGNLPQMAAILYAIKPTVVAIVLFAAYRIGKRVLKNALLWAVAIAAFVAISFLHWPFPAIVLAAGLLGYFAQRYYPAQFNFGHAHAASKQQYGAAVIDDNSPTPAHALFSWTKFCQYLVVGLAVWLGSLAIMVAALGWQATLTQMAWFFSKAALLTFGGAYAVLPYVFQGAVEHYHWLSAPQMMDGLALGETTPGPLIMVVAFVGFVGGWTHAVLGPECLILSGITAACVVTFFTFLPSFLFIFIGAPIIESTQNKLHFTAPLNAITAAVVGVIVSLALFFAQHIFIPNGVSKPDFVAIIITLCALFALLKWNLSIIKLVLISAAIGFFKYVF